MNIGIRCRSLSFLLSLQLAAQPVLASFRGAGNNLTVEAGEDYQSSEYHRTQTKKSWGGLKKKTTTTDHVEEHLTHTASTLSGKGGVSLEAGNNTTVVGSKLHSGGNLDIASGGQLTVLAAEDKHVVQHDQKTKKSFAGINYGKSTSSSTSTQTRVAGSAADAMGDMATTSGGSSTFQASQFKAGGNITLKAGVDKDGNILDPNAKIYFATAQEYTAYREELYKTNGLWFVQSNQGKEETTAAYNQFDSKNLQVEATGGIIADVGVNSSQGETTAQVIGKLATQPGMEWLAQLQQQSQDPNNPTPVQWQQVETAFRDWDYKQEGLTPQAAALISIAVAIATNGMGANLFNSAFSTQIQNAALQSTLNAGFTTLSQQAAVTLINNKGDIGKTLNQLGSSSSLKALATSMITAGLSNKLGSTFNLTGDKLTLAQQFQQKALNGLVSASVSAAIEGGNIGEALQTQLKNAAITTISGAVANKIGDLYSADELNYLTHKIAHAALGCVAGAAANDDCESGALGAVAGEVAAEAWFKGNLEAAIKSGQLDELKRNGVNAAELASAIAATLAQKDANLAVMTARTAAENNAQKHWGNFQSELETCTYKPATSGCDAVFRMAGDGQNVPRADLETEDFGVIANYNKDGTIASYTLTDKTTNKPLLIMEPLEFAAFQLTPQIYQKAYPYSDQWALDYASGLLYASTGDTRRALEEVASMFDEPGYWAGMIGGLPVGSAAGKLATRTASSEEGKVVQIWAFQGGRGDTFSKVIKDSDPTLRAEAYTGHVGISMDGGKTIYGFGPNVTSGLSKMSVITDLRSRQTYSGQITNDTILFNDIMSGRYDPSNAAAISLYRLDVPVTPVTWGNLEAAIFNREIPNVRYGFPDATHPTATVRNCATAFGECGLPIPSSDGNLKEYIPAMIKQDAIKVR